MEIFKPPQSGQRRKASCGAECPSGEVAGERQRREKERRREKSDKAREMKTLVNE